MDRKQIEEHADQALVTLRSSAHGMTRAEFSAFVADLVVEQVNRTVDRAARIAQGHTCRLFKRPTRCRQHIADEITQLKVE